VFPTILTVLRNAALPVTVINPPITELLATFELPKIKILFEAIIPLPELKAYRGPPIFA
jgi:hypothetical protein